MKFSKNPDTGDPSKILQSFERIDMNVHCCRYWWLKRWKHERLSFPYWRLYWNKTPGAYVFFENRVSIVPEQIVLIPPYTPFYTGITSDEDNNEDYCLEGDWVRSKDLERSAIDEGYIMHFFIHFNLGYHYDGIQPGIYPVELSEKQLGLLSGLIGNLMNSRMTFDLEHSLEIYDLVLSSVREIPGKAWKEFRVGTKIQNVVNYINLHLDEHMGNELLAGKIHMAPNSFTRLFKQQTGLSPQDFIRKKRVEHASKLLYHTDHSIKLISERCGFNDRYYFTRVFNNIMGIPPASYRKKLQLNRV